MADGRSSAAWDHTASLMAMMLNAAPFRAPNARLAQPRDFHPDYRSKTVAGDEPLKVPLAMLLPLFAPKP